MKIINFIVPSECYGNILYSLINPILSYLPNYTISKECIDNAINVHFFREEGYKKNVGLAKSKTINVFEAHGLACKNWHNSRHVQPFSCVFVSGQSLVDKYKKQGLTNTEVFITGYTKLDPIFNGTYIKQKYDKPVVLFAPTHKTIEDVSLQDRFDSCLQKIEKEYVLICSQHPVYSESHNPTLQALCDADVVISDTSSLVYEAWSLGKHVIFADWLIKDGVIKYFPNSFESQIYCNNIGLHLENDSLLMNNIEYALNHPIQQNVIDFIDGIFSPELRGHSGKKHAEKLIELANRR